MAPRTRWPHTHHRTTHTQPRRPEMTHKSGRSAFQYALNRVQALSTKHSEQAEIISLGATAWAYGITPEMMDVFGRIASSMRFTAEDLRQLERQNITDRVTRKPWLDAKSGEIWALTGAGGLEQPWRRMDNGTWVSCTSNPQRYSAEQAIAGRRIWPEPEPEEPTETAVAYALAYRALQELFVAVNTKKDDGK